MIRHDEARALALDCLPKCSAEIVVIDRLTIERPWGWVFFYNTRAFVETGELVHALVGNAPIFVERETGRVSTAGTACPLDVYLERFEATGDPHQQLGRVLNVDAVEPGAAPLAAAQQLHRELGLPLLAAKRGLEAVAQGACFEIRTPDPQAAANLCRSLSRFGYVARQLPEPA